MNLEYEDNTLDGILRRVVSNEEDFERIKAALVKGLQGQLCKDGGRKGLYI